MWGLLALSGKASVLPASTIYRDKCFPHAHPHLSSVTGRPWHSLMVSSLWALGAGKGRRGEISQDLRMIQPSSVPQTPAPLPQPHGFCAWYRERQCFVNDGEKNFFFVISSKFGNQHSAGTSCYSPQRVSGSCRLVVPLPTASPARLENDGKWYCGSAMWQVCKWMHAVRKIEKNSRRSVKF